MSNNSIFFLQKDGLDTNCSVYSLTSGSIQIQDLSNGSWSRNITDTLLPAYYVTNCSISNVIERINNLLVSGSKSDWEKSYKCSIYNSSDNGDTFVALLFTISGSCISGWMLSLIFFLSPKIKRKPILTQLATIFYTIVTTILLTHITDISTSQYYHDTLNITKLYEGIYGTTDYHVTIVISQLLTMLAVFQIVVTKLTSSRVKWHSGVIGTLIICAYTSILIAYEAGFNNIRMIEDNEIRYEITFNGLMILRIALKIVFIIWFAFFLFYYTTSLKNPRICYTKRLIPLALFIWFIFGLHLVLSILSISLFKNNWLVNTWLNLIPNLLEIYLLTLVWEWISSVKFIEKRYELMGVLGRRISIDDVVSFRDDNDQSQSQNKNQSLKSFFKYVLNVALGKRNSLAAPTIRSYLDKDTELQIILSGSTNSSNSKQITDTTLFNTATNANTNYNAGNVPQSNQTDDQSIQSEDTTQSYEIEYVDNYDIWDDSEQPPQEGPSSQVQPQPHHSTDHDPLPPPFVPHPGFSHDDYYPDEKS